LPPVLNVVIIGLIIYYSEDHYYGEGGFGYSLILMGWLSVTTTFFAILTQVRLDAPYDPTYEPDRYKRYLSLVRPLGNLIQKTALITIPILIASISYTSFLAYSDYSTAGMKYNNTNQSNSSVMYKKATESMDISFCDHIVNSPYGTWRRNCYQSFFEKIDEIKSFEERNRKNSIKISFFTIYIKHKQQCSRSEEPDLCINALLKQTREILELEATKILDYASSATIEEVDGVPKYLIISIYDNQKYKSLYKSLLIDLDKFKSRSFELIKKENSDGNNRILIYIDIKKLIDYKNDLIEIDKIIRFRIKCLSRRYAKNQKEKEEIEKIKAHFDKIKWDKLIRKRYKLGPNDPIEYEPCPIDSTKYLSGSAGICINGIEIPHAGSKAPKSFK